MALELFCWGPSLDLLRDSRNGALWLEHWLYNVVLTVGFVDKISSGTLSHGAIRCKYFSSI